MQEWVFLVNVCVSGSQDELILLGRSEGRIAGCWTCTSIMGRKVLSTLKMMLMANIALMERPGVPRVHVDASPLRPQITISGSSSSDELMLSMGF
jgi:hypothetical protein